MVSVLSRSSLRQSGVGVGAGVVDAAIEGAMGALMEVKNPMELFFVHAKLAEIVFKETGRTIDEYSGI